MEKANSEGLSGVNDQAHPQSQQFFRIIDGNGVLLSQLSEKEHLIHSDDAVCKLLISKDKSVQLGSDNFKDIISAGIFVDKSLFIQEVINHTCSHIVITRPEKMGKTANLTMVYEFLNLNVDANGSVCEPENALLFQGGVLAGKVYQRLGIADTPVFESHFAKWPVIFVDLKEVQCIDGIKQVISKSFRSHLYLLNVFKNVRESTTASYADKCLAKMNAKTFKQILNKQSSQQGLKRSLEFLTEVLHLLFKKKAIILVDNYDAPFNNSVFQPEHEDVVKTISSFYSYSFQGNQHVEKAVLVGILPMTREIFATGVSFSEYDVLDKEYSDKFGFTTKETDSILDHLFEPTEQAQRQRVLMKLWYGGIKIGNNTVHHPLSVMSCLANAKFQAIKMYWKGVKHIHLLKSTFQEYGQQFQQLLSKGYMHFQIKNLTAYCELRIPSDKNFYALLVHLGFLTPTNKKEQYKVPNLQVKQSIIANLFPYWSQKTFGKNVKVLELMTRLINSLENVSQYKSLIKVHLLEKMSHGQKREADFHALIGGISCLAWLTLSNVTHSVQFEFPTFQSKRLDNIFFPILGKSTSVIVHEYKKRQGNVELKDVAEDAFWQIFVNRYINAPLTLKREHSHNDFWLRVMVRSVVFSKDISCSKWSVDIEEFSFNFEVAAILDQIFSGLDKKDRQNLLSGKEKGILRRNFLKNLRADSLSQLIQMSEALQYSSFAAFKEGPSTPQAINSNHGKAPFSAFFFFYKQQMDKDPVSFKASSIKFIKDCSDRYKELPPEEKTVYVLRSQKAQKEYEDRKENEKKASTQAKGGRKYKRN